MKAHSCVDRNDDEDVYYLLQIHTVQDVLRYTQSAAEETSHTSIQIFLTEDDNCRFMFHILHTHTEVTSIQIQ